MTKLKDWKIVDWLKDKGLDIAEGAMNGGLLGAASALISKDPGLSDGDKIDKLKELNSFQLAMAQEETERIKAVQETERVQLSQEDLFTKRARPFRMYVWVLVIVTCYPVAWIFTAVLSLYHGGEMVGQVVPLDWEIVMGMFADMGVYTVSRSQEKTGKNPISLGGLFGKK